MGEQPASELSEGPCFFWPSPPPRRDPRVRELALHLSRTLALARALVRSGRTLDITGMQDGVGLLCAQTLDLPVEQARALLPELQDVLSQLDLLARAVSTPRGAAPPQC